MIRGGKIPVWHVCDANQGPDVATSKRRKGRGVLYVRLLMTHNVGDDDEVADGT